MVYQNSHLSPWPDSQPIRSNTCSNIQTLNQLDPSQSTGYPNQLVLPVKWSLQPTGPSSQLVIPVNWPPPPKCARHLSNASDIYQMSPVAHLHPVFQVVLRIKWNIHFEYLWMHCAHFHSLHCTEERPADRRLADVEATYHDLSVSAPLRIGMSTSKAQCRSWASRIWD